MTPKANVRKYKHFLYVNVWLKNHKEDIDLQWKLEQIHRKYKLGLKLLNQDREFLLLEHKKLLHLKICEPRATLTNTMKDILDAQRTNIDFQYVWHPSSAPVCRRILTGERRSNKNDQLQDTRLVKSAPPRSYESNQLSIMYLKDLALIDSISQKELAIQEEQKRRKKESLKRLYKEKLQEKIQGFFRTLENV